MKLPKWLVGLSVGFLFVVCLLPVRLSIMFDEEPVYADVAINTDSFHVKARSVIGIGYPLHDFTYQRKEQTVRVWWNGLSATKTRDVKKPDSFEVTYDGSVYAGQSLDRQKLHVTAVYGDAKRGLSEFTVTAEPMPMAKEVTVTIQTAAGITEWKTELVIPEKVSAVYDTEPAIGDRFLKDHVKVMLAYPDGTIGETRNFKVKNAPMYLNQDVTLGITSDYGDCEVAIHPVNQQTLSASYEKTVYAGQTLDKSLLKLSMKKPDGNTENITDFTFENPGKILTKTVVTLHSKYGDGVVTIDPVGVQSSTVKLDDAYFEGDVPAISKIQIQYADNQVLDLSSSEFTLLNPEQKLSEGKNTIWYYAKDLGLYHSFEVTALPLKVKEIREDSVYQSEKSYDLTDDQADFIQLVVRRIFGTEQDDFLKGVTVLLQSYESGHGKTSGSDVVSWLKETYGESYTSGMYVSEEFAIYSDYVKDVFVNGYRYLPEYVSVFYNTSDIRDFDKYDADVSEFVKDKTEMTLENDMMVRFYDEADGVLLGYTKENYESVTGETLSKGDPLKTKEEVKESEDSGIVITDVTDS